MKEEEFKEYKLRVPSQMEIATVTNIRKFVEILPKLPDTFVNTDVANIKEYPLNNEDAISRTLSYFKYLELLTEERPRGKRGDKKISLQRFHLTDKGKELKEVAIYEPDNLNAKWKDILKDSELYKALVTNEEFERWNHISKTTLRKLLGDSFSKKVKNVKERVDKAEEYLINFVTDAGLFISDGDCLRLVKEMEGKIPQKKKEEKASIGEVTIEEPLGEESMITPSKGLTYIKDDDFELKIKLNDLSLKLLEKQIEVLKIKLESMHNKQRNGGNDVEE